MEGFFRGIGDVFKQYIIQPFRDFSAWDAVDIVLLGVLLYCVYLFFKGRRAGKLAVGLALIFILYAVSDMLGLRALHRILAGIAPFTVILVAVIFQPELRDALEKLGNRAVGLRNVNAKDQANLSNTINEVVDAVCRIALSGEDGALIIIERTTKLGEYADKGQQLDAQVSGNLLCNIFVNRSPLHDGAVIIRNNRIAAAGSKLPLTVNEEVVRGMGTRHRAAVGITEVSDCVAVVVSEERHQISIANNGLLKRDYHRTPDELRSEASLKDIQNALRNDLFKLLAGIDLEESELLGKNDKGKDRKSVGKKSDGGRGEARRLRKSSGKKLNHDSAEVAPTAEAETASTPPMTTDASDVGDTP